MKTITHNTHTCEYTLRYIMVSGKKALIDAGLPEGSDEIKQIDPARAGILIGTAMGGMKSFETAVSNLHLQGGPAHIAQHKRMHDS